MPCVCILAAPQHNIFCNKPQHTKGLQHTPPTHTHEPLTHNFSLTHTHTYTALFALFGSTNLLPPCETQNQGSSFWRQMSQCPPSKKFWGWSCRVLLLWQVCLCHYTYTYAPIYKCVHGYIFMCICVYVYVCICVCVYMCMCVYVYMCECVYVYVCMCVCVYMCMRVYVYMCMRVCVYMCMHYASHAGCRFRGRCTCAMYIRMCICIHVCIHINVYISIYALCES